MSRYPEWLTLHEIDRACGATKGSAFRAFKRIEPSLVEQRDYAVLHHAGDRAALDELRSAGRIYAGSVNVVVVAPEVAARLRAELQ